MIGNKIFHEDEKRNGWNGELYLNVINQNKFKNTLAAYHREQLQV